MANTAITVQGQAWDQVALTRLGSEKQMNAIVDANKDNLDVLLFEGGITLDIPDVPRIANHSLPPWEKM